VGAVGLLTQTSLLFLVLAMGSAPLLAPLSLYFDRERQTRVRQEAVAALESCGDPEAVGVLAAAWRDGTSEVRQSIEQALNTLLPNLTPEHFESIRFDTTPNLCHILIRTRDTRYLLIHKGIAGNLLEALEKVGDHRAVEPLERFINGHPLGELRAKAQAVLQVVATREPRQDHGGVLLRAANEPTHAEKELLRPASGANTTPPEQLLRPALGENPDATR
jgi:HEAT repeat protein